MNKNKLKDRKNRINQRNYQLFEMMMEIWHNFNENRIFDEIFMRQNIEMRMQIERKSENQGNIGKLRFDK